MTADDRHADALLALWDTVLRSPGRTSSERRAAAAAGGADLPPELRALVEAIHHHAYRITDEEVAALAARFDQDELFEIIVCAALGASRERLLAGLRALEEAG